MFGFFDLLHTRHLCLKKKETVPIDVCVGRFSPVYFLATQAITFCVKTSRWLCRT